MIYVKITLAPHTDPRKAWKQCKGQGLTGSCIRTDGLIGGYIAEDRIPRLEALQLVASVESIPTNRR